MFGWQTPIRACRMCVPCKSRLIITFQRASFKSVNDFFFYLFMGLGKKQAVAVRAIGTYYILVFPHRFCDIMMICEPKGCVVLSVLKLCITYKYIHIFFLFLFIITLSKRLDIPGVLVLSVYMSKIVWCDILYWIVYLHNIPS